MPLNNDKPNSSGLVTINDVIMQTTLNNFANKTQPTTFSLFKERQRAFIAKSIILTGYVS